MTGHGSRFKDAGYQKLKPFINIRGKPLIEWVLKLFTEDVDQISFICQQTHLESLVYMKPTLRKLAPNSNIYVVNDWEKKGPVNDVIQKSQFIDDNKPVIICYCDFYMHWDYNNFKQEVFKKNCDGAIPCYTGFHPHLLPPENLYASCKVDNNENLIKIREKFSWEVDRTKARHSPGLYYFRSGNIMKKYCKIMMEANDHINGEYYASLPFNYMVDDGLKVWCPINVPFFCQWGTPEDLNESLFWINLVEGLKK